MSYILDALNRSDSERRNKAGPEIEALAVGDHAPRQSIPRYAMAAAALVLMVAVVIVAYLNLADRGDDMADADGGAAEVATAAQAAHLEASEDAPIMPITFGALETSVEENQPQALNSKAPNSRAPDSGVANPQATTAVPARPSTSPPANPSLSVGGEGAIRPAVTKTFADLPLEVQRLVPGIKVTTHIFSSDPSLRLVKIDGEAKREGEALKGDMRLEKITETGVVLGIGTHSFRVDILRDWSPQP